MAQSKTISFTPRNGPRWVIWTGFAIVLLIMPWIFNSSSSRNILALMGIIMIFGLSYNMLLGQTGMMSFGHAVYSGLGAFFAIHALNAWGKGGFPVSLIPIIGGLAGAFFGAFFGWVCTKRAGTTFAMITMGIGELVFACSLMFPQFFGGEGGISTNRVVGQPFLGINYGAQIQVYYLVVIWLFIATALMYAITRTPLGRMANAVRDNPERAAFIGYNTQVVRYWMIILSGFFAGVSGGLSAINAEIVSAENVSAARSGTVLLFSFIGGIGLFFGPMIGAVIAVLSFAVLSEITRAWQLYLGLFFVLMILYAPFGISGMIMLNLRVAINGLYPKIRHSLAWVSGAGFLLALGFVMLVEVGYQIFLDAAPGADIKIFGKTTKANEPMLWFCISALLGLGAYLLHVWRPRFVADWGHVQAEIEARELAAARAA